MDRLASLPGVKSAGATAALPLGPTSIGLAFDVAGRPEAPSGEEYTARSSSVTPDYFRTMGIALRNGRFFTDSDRRDAPGVAIINETMARQYWPNENPLGQVIMPSAQLGDNDPQSYEIVGIVSDVRARAVDVAARPSMYFPFEQQTWPFMSFALRTAGDPLDLVGAVRHEIAGITNQEAAFRFNRMDQYVSDSTEGRRFPMLLLAVFAGLAVTLAATGIYAMLSYSVSRRTHEIGVRMAIGAQKANILCFIVRYGLTLTAIGLGAGLAAALAAGRLLASQLYEISALDPITFVVMSLLLGFVALIACYIPARRATKVDPMVALRYE